ncbi:MAG: hypothetical protein KJZ75_11295 [Hyphomonadaceae bacterium]|nr:hypothetical protein [Hyphomonadaceae bacterium]
MIETPQHILNTLSAQARKKPTKQGRGLKSDKPLTFPAHRQRDVHCFVRNAWC